MGPQLQTRHTSTSKAPDEPSGSIRGRVLFFAVAWGMVLGMFYLWYHGNTRLSDEQISAYLSDNQPLTNTRQALQEIAGRMAHHDSSSAQFYPQMLHLTHSPTEEIRGIDAYLMGQDTSRTEFHEALQSLLDDPSPTVRTNAALSLNRFGDSAGRAALVNMLRQQVITAPEAGRITQIGAPGTTVTQGMVAARIQTDRGTLELRWPHGGRVQSIGAQAGASVTAGAQLAVLEPPQEQVTQALRGLYLIGEKGDLAAIKPYQNSQDQQDERIRQQALLAEQAILGRAEKSN